MASIVVLTDPPTDIDYSIIDGRIRSFILYGETLFDEHEKIYTPGWKEKLIKFVVDNRLNIDNDGHGLHAFIYRLQEDGLLI